MECANSDDEAKDDEMNQQDQQELVAKSRWDDPSEDKLDKLDAVGSFRRRKRRLPSEAEEELSLTEYLRRKQEEEENAGPKRKRVRWADLEAVKEEQRKKEVGFCIGGGWSQLSSEEAETILRGKTNNTVAAEQVSSDQMPRQPL